MLSPSKVLPPNANIAVWSEFRCPYLPCLSYPFGVTTGENPTSKIKYWKFYRVIHTLRSLLLLPLLITISSGIVIAMDLFFLDGTDALHYYYRYYYYYLCLSHRMFQG